MSAHPFMQDVSPLAQFLNELASAELPHSVHSTVLEASHVVCSGASYLTSFTVNNTNVSAQFIQLFDVALLPGNGAVPSTVFTVAGSADRSITFGIPGRFFGAGIVICNSSTAATKTVGAADCFFDVQYLPVG